MNNILKKLKKKSLEKKGFTLIEMIIVIAIIAILIALIAPNLMEFLGTANDTKRSAAAKTLYTSAQSYVTKMYVAGTPIADATYSKGGLGTDFDSKFFNAEELARITAYTVEVKEGAVVKATVTMDGKQAEYPAKTATGGGSGTT